MLHRTEESGDVCGFVYERGIHNTHVHKPLLVSKRRLVLLQETLQDTQCFSTVTCYFPSGNSTTNLIWSLLTANINFKMLDKCPPPRIILITDQVKSTDNEAFILNTCSGTPYSRQPGDQITGAVVLNPSGIHSDGKSPESVPSPVSLWSGGSAVKKICGEKKLLGLILAQNSDTVGLHETKL